MPEANRLYVSNSERITYTALHAGSMGTQFYANGARTLALVYAPPQPATPTRVPATAVPGGLVGTLFWTNTIDKIGIVGTDGSTPRLFGKHNGNSEAFERPRNISYGSDGKVYCTTLARSDLFRGNPDGTGVEKILTLSTNAGRIIVDRNANAVYWATEVGGIRSTSMTDRTEKVIFQSNYNEFAALPMALDTARSRLYFANPEANGQYTFMRVNVNGSDAQQLFTTSNRPDAITFDPYNEKIYWADLVSGTMRIRRANLDGSSIETITTGTRKVFDILVDGASNRVYWSDDQ